MLLLREYNHEHRVKGSRGAMKREFIGVARKAAKTPRTVAILLSDSLHRAFASWREVLFTLPTAVFNSGRAAGAAIARLSAVRSSRTGLISARGLRHGASVTW